MRAPHFRRAPKSKQGCDLRAIGLLPAQNTSDRQLPQSGGFSLAVDPPASDQPAHRY